MSGYESRLGPIISRVGPGEDLVGQLMKFVERNNLTSAFVLTCCGSVNKATLRFAEKPDGSAKTVKTFLEHFEICSMVGTLSIGGGPHLHTVLSRPDGTTVAGHIMGGLQIFTTAEVVLGDCGPQVLFRRVMDSETGYRELMVVQNREQKE